MKCVREIKFLQANSVFIENTIVGAKFGQPEYIDRDSLRK